MVVGELLGQGAKSARTGKELAQLLNCTTRDIAHAIENERRKGMPICASCEAPKGYYIAETEEELAGYCESLRHRAGEIFKTRRALLAILEKVRDKKATEAE